MSMLKTFRLWLEPDEEFPMFQRLEAELVDVPIRDVLMGGVHPWAETSDGVDKHPTLVEAFLLRLNDAASKSTEFEPFGYCHDISSQSSPYRQRQTRFEQTLLHIRKAVYFVEDLTYLQLLEIAKRHLGEQWDNCLALTLAQRVHPGFPELRRFLKAKDSAIKLSGHLDLDRYDFGEVLALEDFDGWDGVLLSAAFPTLNFRRTTFLDQVTDAQGRLRLVPDIRKVTLTVVPDASDYIHLFWHVVRNGEAWCFRPGIARSDAKRRKAKQFAEQWRRDDGRLCFQTSVDELVRMVDDRVVVPSFPALNYTRDFLGPTAIADVPEDRIPSYHIGGFYSHRTRSGDLREILREYGVSMTGNKGQLLLKLAKLAAKEYGTHREDMGSFFAEHRFVRIAKVPPGSQRLPLLEDEPLLRNLLLTMYAVRHLRGNAVLDVSHENNTYTVEQLALALVRGNVGLSGAFLRVA